MKKVFISYRFTGEKKDNLKKTILKLHKFVKNAGFECYSTILDTDQFSSKKWSGKKIMQKAFAKIKDSDIILFFVNSDKVSEGMLLELGFTLAQNKKVVLAIHKNIKQSIY